MKNQINRITAFVLALAVGPVVANAGTPVLGANGNFYEFVDTSGRPQANRDWDTVNGEANALTFNGIVGHLATITSQAEDLNIESLRQASGVAGELYVGGFQDPVTTDPKANWQWVNGEGPFPGDNLGPVYANWHNGEPNDSGVESHLAIGFFGNGGGWNDEGALGNIKGYVVEYDFSSVFVPPSEDPITFLDGADDPDSPHGLSAGYQQVLEGGNFTVDCCTIVDWREGAGHNKHHDYFLPVNLDLGVAIDLAAAGTDMSCKDLQVYGSETAPEFGAGKAKLHRWQRGVPRSAGIPSGTAGGEHDIGVCLIRSEVISRGVLFSAEETLNTLDYAVNCSEPRVKNRPFASSVALDPTDVHTPFAIRQSADCDRSRSGKRSSDRLVVLNTWHSKRHKPTIPYLVQIANSLRQTIQIERMRMPACVDNSEGFLDDLKRYLRVAKRNFKFRTRRAIRAERALNDATRLALLISSGPRPIPVPTPLPANDPYISSAFCDTNNAQGLLVGGFMALKFAACSELQHPFDSSSSSEVSDPRCEIASDILAEMPDLSPPMP